MVLEYASNGSLDGFLNDDSKQALLPAATRLSIMYHVMRAVHFLHKGEKGWRVFHRDIKSSNICLMKDFTPKLIDCGLAKFVEDEHNAFPSKTIVITGSKGRVAFGSIGYMCPEYISKIANGNKVEYIPDYDVYSFGVVMAELISGHLNDQRNNNVLQKYVRNGDEKFIVDGWERLKQDAKKNCPWNTDALDVVCLTAIGCLIRTSEGRLSTGKLLDLLKHAIDIQAGASNVEPKGERVDHPPKKLPGTDNILLLLNEILSNIGKGNAEPEGADVVSCIACRRRSVKKCSEGHGNCVQCIEEALESGTDAGDFGLPCLSDGCSSSPFAHEVLCECIGRRKYNKIMNQIDGVKQGVDDLKQGVNDLKQVAVKTQDMVEKLASVVDRHLPGWVLQNANPERLKCPSVVVLTRIAVGRSKDLRTWFNCIGKHKYNVVFYCENSGDPGHEPFEITVDKNWIVNVAPWLRIVINIGAAWDPTKVLNGVIKEFPLPAHTKEMKDLIDALGKKEKEGEKQTLQGGALEAIAKMANEEENLKMWRDMMKPVYGKNKRTMWVKKVEKPFRDENEDGLWA